MTGKQLQISCRRHRFSMEDAPYHITSSQRSAICRDSLVAILSGEEHLLLLPILFLLRSPHHPPLSPPSPLSPLPSYSTSRITMTLIFHIFLSFPQDAHVTRGNVEHIVSVSLKIASVSLSVIDSQPAEIAYISLKGVYVVRV